LPHISLPKLVKSIVDRGHLSLSIAVGGTECYDVSAMGAGKGLTGPTAKTLATWLESRRRAHEDRIYRLGIGNGNGSY